MDRRENWEVTLRVDGVEIVQALTISPPFGIRKADAEVRAIRIAIADGGKDVRALGSRFMGVER